MSTASGTARPPAGTAPPAPRQPPGTRTAGPAGPGPVGPGPVRSSPGPASGPPSGPASWLAEPWSAVAAACRVFAAQPKQIAHARRFIAGVLSGFGAADDVVLCVCELASNAVLHSSSREPGGQFTVRVTVSPCGRIRAEVADRGGPWTTGVMPDEERGRGLLIVDALATRWGITGSDTGRSAWLELDPGGRSRT
jgi:serine/threonine-protein kinase RsbW